MQRQSKTPLTLTEAAKVRAACHKHASDLISAAERLLNEPAKPNLSYHFALLALEEIGKSGLIIGQAAMGSIRDSDWIDRAVSSHSRKLLWALWSPIQKIDPIRFKKARAYAERLHAQRLAGLYVDHMIDSSSPQDVVTLSEARSMIDLARSRLAVEVETEVSQPGVEALEILGWFLQTLDDPEGMRQLFSRQFLERFEELDGDAAQWMRWAKSECERRVAEVDAILREELARQPKTDGDQPKWRVRVKVHTVTHSIRPKVLNYWNDRAAPTVKLIPTGKKDEFLLELMIPDAVSLADLFGYTIGKAKMILAFLSIGSMGFFWFEKPASTKRLIEQASDLTRPDFDVLIGPALAVWDKRATTALAEQHLQHALECVGTYMPMEEDVAEPIFGPYFHGLALVAKSDFHISTDLSARTAFVASLRSALRYYNAWDGQEQSFHDCVDRAFQPIILDMEHRRTMFEVFDGAPTKSAAISENTIAAKNLVDLFLIWIARRRWKQV